jgi:ribonuclease E
VTAEEPVAAPAKRSRRKKTDVSAVEPAEAAAEALAEVATPAEPEPAPAEPAPAPRKGWWQRTFGA